MKTLFRNFTSIFRKYTVPMSLNILGLAVAFAVFLIIMMQLDFDRNFDSCHLNANRIFRLELNQIGEGWANTNCRPFGELLIASSPHILAGAIADEIDLGSGSTDLTFDAPTGKITMHEQIIDVTPGYADVFTFNMIEGNSKALQEPDNILIPQSMARKLFGSDNAVGKILKSLRGDFTVGGVYADFPRNSSTGNHVYAPFPKDKHVDNWSLWNYSCYIRIDDASDADRLLADFRKTVKITERVGDIPLKEEDIQFRLSPLSELHYVANVRYDTVPKSDRRTETILLVIAIAILLIGGINFSNFSMALAPKRIRSVNTQKVFGAKNRYIRGLLIAESLCTSLLAFFIALGIIELLSRTAVAGLIDARMSVAAHIFWTGMTAAIAVLTGIAAGVYPALYVTSFPPALVLKGSFGLSPKGRALRNVLVGIQFTASFALIISASFIYLQNRFMETSASGYKRDELIVAKLNNRIAKQADAFADKLLSDAAIGDVAFGMSLFGADDNFNRWGMDYKGKPTMTNVFVVSPGFPEMLGIKVSEGRNYRTGEKGKYIFNQLARNEYELELNDLIGEAEIIGFVPDVRFASFRKNVEPMAFYVPDDGWDEGWMDFAYVRVNAGAGMREAISHVRNTLKSMDGEAIFDVFFFDEALNRLYEQERRLSMMIALFGLVAVLTSMAGVFGLVVFDNEYRRREIGIRKVFGSTTGQILSLFNKTYVCILCVCFLPAAILSHTIISEWMLNFAYRTPMHWWVYAAAFGSVTLLTVATVSLQNRRTASLNPSLTITES